MEDAVIQNQQMISEWMESCDKNKFLTYMMLAVDQNNNMVTFKSAAMDRDMMILQFEQALHTLKFSKK